MITMIRWLLVAIAASLALTMDGSFTSAACAPTCWGPECFLRNGNSCWWDPLGCKNEWIHDNDFGTIACGMPSNHNWYLFATCDAGPCAGQQNPEPAYACDTDGMSCPPITRACYPICSLTGCTGH
ncbi:MAG: hypothetical protein HYS13_12405 [Planctomycetia bacterium]|nr:hypothetical protein [Planctomycetia bacterium]